MELVDPAALKSYEDPRNTTLLQGDADSDSYISTKDWSNTHIVHQYTKDLSEFCCTTNTTKGTSHRFFVTIFAENHLMSLFHPIFVISVRNYIFNGTKSKKAYEYFA